MPFRFAKGFMRKSDTPEPARKPILDSQPKDVAQDVYNLPTLEDLPDMPQPVDEFYGQKHESMFKDEPEPPRRANQNVTDLVNDYSKPVRTFPKPIQYPKPSPPAPDAGDMGIRSQLGQVAQRLAQMDSSISRLGQDKEAHDEIINFLTAIDKRLVDMDRRLALLERSMIR